MSDSTPSPTPAVPLSSLAALLGVPGPGADVAVAGVTLDSARVSPGDLFAALPGGQHHGAEFAAQAAGAGAVAALTDAQGAERVVAAGLPALVVPDPRSVLGSVATAVYGHPDRRLLLFGITGTNGKTTTAYLADAGLHAAGHVTGLVGTIETRVAGRVLPSQRTTPEAPDVQRLLAEMVAAGCTAAVMEVSSHALALGRVDGTTYDVAAFTNLSQDHLDFHHDMEHYYESKARLFTAGRARAAVVAVDDEWGRRLASETALPVTTLTTRPDVEADWSAVEVVPGAAGSTFRAVGPSGENVPVRVPFPGSFNVANALVALVMLAVGGVPPAEAATGIATAGGVPGRMETIDVGQEWLAVVDYAHTPEAVAALLESVRSVTSGRVLVVLGCGGDRDPTKRPLMGAAAVRGADVVVVTSDNPRHEDPAAIIAAVVAGAVDAQELSGRDEVELLVEPDRAAAITAAVVRARPGDAVVVAGKGHEQGQELASIVLPFDDRVVLRDAIGALA